MENGTRNFTCKGRQLAGYLKKHGSKLKETRRENGVTVYVFEYDDTIDANIEKWKSILGKCFFKA